MEIRRDEKCVEDGVDADVTQRLEGRHRYFSLSLHSSAKL